VLLTPELYFQFDYDYDNDDNDNDNDNANDNAINLWHRRRAMPMRATDAAFIMIPLLCAAPAVPAGSIYKCTQADGSITLSDVACPQGTVDRAYQGETASSRGRTSGSADPYSIMEQVRGIEKRENAERAAARQRQGRDKATRTTPPKQPPEPVLSYQEARQKALDATGYHNDATLSQTQRERVQDEMAKYPHRPGKADNGPAKSRGKAGNAKSSAAPVVPGADDDARAGALLPMR